MYDDAVRTRLLDAAAAHVFEHGVETMSVRGIATAAETTTSAIYRLFGNRDGLVAALFARAAARFAEGLSRAAVTRDPMEDLVAIGMAYRAAASADRHGYRVLFGGMVDPVALPTEVGRAAADLFEPLLARVNAAQVAGVLTADVTTPEIATSLWAHVHGLVVLELGLPRPPASGDPATVYGRSVRALLRGWGAED